LETASKPSRDVLLAISSKLEGYLVKDLDSLVNRAVHAHAVFSLHSE